MTRFGERIESIHQEHPILSGRGVTIESSEPRVSLSVVVPVRDEEQVLPEFHARLTHTLDSLDRSAEICYVNDGSRDKTLTVLRELRGRDPRVTIIDLSRNFGKEIALTAGLDYARGDSVVVIDADLQDPPELIPQLLDRLADGYDVAYAQRIARDGETVVKRLTAHVFYRAARSLGEVELPRDVGDFRALSRQAVNALRLLRERHRFMKGLFSWIGFDQVAVPYRREPRHAGKTKWNYWRLWNFALEGITSFSTAPLRIATYVGLTAAGLAFIFAGFIAAQKILYGNPVPGYPSLIVVVSFLGGMQLAALGIIGEYLGRLFNEAKGRPLYLVRSLERARINLTDSLEAIEREAETEHPLAMTDRPRTI
jgi:glycosyltransferase involved in cell wall biosynthesis